MAPTYRAERDRGSKEFPQQIVVLRDMATRFSDGLSGFLTLSQFDDRPERYDGAMSRRLNRRHDRRQSVARPTGRRIAPAGRCTAGRPR
jgi:hypothetical protein